MRANTSPVKRCWWMAAFPPAQPGRCPQESPDAGQLGALPATEMKNMGRGPQLRFQIFPDSARMSRAAAELIAARLHKTPELLLCASAGGTPSGTYRELARICRSQPEIFAKLRVLQIDEWGGLPAGSPATCAADLQEKLSGPLNINKGRFCGFRSDAADPE